MIERSTPDTQSPPAARVAAIIAVLTGAVCLSASAVIVRLAAVDAATTAVLRCAMALVPLIPLELWEARRTGALSRRGIAWSVAAGIALGVDYSAWTASIFLVGDGVSTVLINVQVIVLPLLALVVDGERTTRRFLAALPLMVFGVALVGGLDFTTAGSGADAGSLSGRLGGILLGLLAGTGYGVYLFLTRRATTKQEAELALQPLAWATGSAALTSAIIAQFSGGLHLAGISTRSWLLLGILALVGQVAAWLLLHHGSVRLPASTTASLLLIQPVLALSLSALILGETFGPGQLVGAGLVVGTVALASGAVPAHPRRERP